MGIEPVHSIFECEEILSNIFLKIDYISAYLFVYMPFHCFKFDHSLIYNPNLKLSLGPDALSSISAILVESK